MSPKNKILIIEDDPSIRDLIYDTFKATLEYKLIARGAPEQAIPNLPDNNYRHNRFSNEALVRGDVVFITDYGTAMKYLDGKGIDSKGDPLPDVDDIAVVITDLKINSGNSDPEYPIDPQYQSILGRLIYEHLKERGDIGIIVSTGFDEVPFYVTDEIRKSNGSLRGYHSKSENNDDLVDQVANMMLALHKTTGESIASPYGQ